ncbi:hypothetical protein COBT_000048 [Conglomerata obtusa]
MVTEGRSFLPRSRFDSTTETGSIIAQEYNCFMKSLKLDTIQMNQLDPRIIMTFFYPLLLTSLIAGFIFLFSLAAYVKPLNLQSSIISFLCIVMYSYIAGYIYRAYLKKSGDSHFLSYVYVCMYSLTYLPLALCFSIMLGPIGSILMFAMVLLTQYTISNNILLGHDFSSNKHRFVFSLLTLVIQFIFLIGFESFIMQSIKLLPV